MRVWLPRSAKRNPEPATRSFTVLDTSTSPAPGKRCDSRADVNGDAADIVAHHFALASMKPGTNFDAKRFDFFGNSASATNAARRTVEGSENAIAGCLDLMAAETSEIASDRGVMTIEQVMPTAIAERGGFLGRADDVGKENGSEHPVDLDWRPRTGQKLLDGIGDLHGIVADEWYVIFSRKLDIARAGNVLGEITSTLDVDGHVFGSMDDKRRHPDRREDIADIDLAVHAHEGGSSGRACAKPLKPAPPALEGRIIRARGREEGQAATGTPGLIDIAEKRLRAPPL